MVDLELETRFRENALAHLRAVQLRTGGPVSNSDVADFWFEGDRARLMDIGRGIRKPRMLSGALSIRTVFAEHPDQRPYEDGEGADGFHRYKWRGTDGTHHENVALRVAMEHRLPMIWFIGYTQGLYLPIAPIWLIHEEPEAHQFVVAMDQAQVDLWSDAPGSRVMRRYASRVTTHRLHQPLFRARVLQAYEKRCAICELRHVDLLEAAHIRPDSQGGEPIVPNGLSLCRIHHGAYDTKMLGITPDYEVRIRSSVLEESDGPTLRHAIQAMNGRSLRVPRSRRARPDRDLLAERFADFEAADS